MPLCLFACHTVAVRDDTAQTVPPSDASSLRRAAQAGAPLPEVGAPPAREPVTSLFPFVEGACPPARVYTVGATPVVVMYRDAWAIGADGARPFYRMGPVVYDPLDGRMRTEDHIGDVGGVDEAHAWVQLRLSASRGEDASSVFIHGPEWKKVETPRGALGFYGLTHVVPQPDGSFWAFGVHSMYLDIPGDRFIRGEDADHNKYFAFAASGEPQKMNLPGPDMAGAVRLSSGELVAAGRTKAGSPVLRRWSPVKKVDDLVLPQASVEADPGLLVGTARAVLLASKQKRAFYNYMGDKLVVSALNARLRDVTSWLVTTSDDLMVTSSDGALFIESKDGTISEERLPEPGRLAGEPSVPWFIAASGSLYTRAEAGWRKVPLPDGPWAADTHPPSRVEWVKVAGGETLVSTVRTDKGFGLKKAGEVRVLYTSKPRSTPLRCGAPFPGTTWAPLPPRPDATCANLAVVVGSEAATESKYPKIGAALKGDARLGESLVFVRFGKGPERLLAIRADAMDVAKAIANRLERVGPQAPEIVCGTPDEDKRLSFHVATGTFSP